MPGPLVLPLIAAGTQLAGAGINAMSNARLNKKTMKWNEKMYGIQRADALADWNRQNEYNSPAQVMARLKAAGLNPNLAYGDIGSGNAPSVRSSSVESWNPRSQSIGEGIGAAGAAFVDSYYTSQMKDKQLDTMNAGLKVAANEAALKAAQTVATLANVDRTKIGTANAQFDLAMKSALAEANLDYANLRNNQIAAQTQYSLDENERRTLLTAQSLEKGVEQIALMRANTAYSRAARSKILQEIENLKKDGTLKQLDIDLRKMGINPNDPMYARVAGRIVNSLSTATYPNSNVPLLNPKNPAKTPSSVLWDSIFNGMLFK